MVAAWNMFTSNSCSNPSSATVCSCVALQEPQADGWGNCGCAKQKVFDSGSWVCVIRLEWVDLGYKNCQEKDGGLQ